MKFLSLFFATLLAVILLPTPMVAAVTPITPGDNLVVEGIPLIPADIVKKVERYTQFRSAGISRSEEHTSELQSQFRISYAVFCLKKKINVPFPTKSIGISMSLLFAAFQRYVVFCHIF